MSGWTLWLILTLDSIRNIYIPFIITLCLVITPLITLLHEDPEIINNFESEKWKLYFGLIKRFALVTFIIIFLRTITPTTKEAFIIYGVPKITQNKHVTETGKKLLTFTKLYLKLKTKEIKEYVNE